MMLHASVLYLSLLMSVASAIDNAIFARDMLFCGRKDGRNELICTRKVGNGYCLDQEGSYYSLCSFTDEEFTLSHCQYYAGRLYTVIGLQYHAADGRCDLVFNRSNPSCLEDFSQIGNYNGVGPIRDVEEDSSVECYACDWIFVSYSD